jgi:predicted SnoaL-like aldol condensation-catalyzing enzyme
VNFQSIDIWRVQDGLLAEHWDQLNMDDLFRQLGVDPAPAQA